MLTVSATGRVFFATQPVDMRKGFNGLIGVIRTVLDEEPRSGDVFCFLNKRRNLLKAICYNGDGFVIYYKRRDRGRFTNPIRQGTKGTVLPAQWMMWLADIPLPTRPTPPLPPYRPLSPP